MNGFWWAVLLSILPVSELRGGIPLAVGLGVNPFLAFFVLTFVNILVIFPIFFFLDFLHGKFLRVRFYRRSFERHVERSRRKLERYIGTKWESVVLFLIVAVPLPGTGAYTGSLLAWVFGLERKKAYLAISLGVLAAGVIVTLVSVGLFSLFK